MQFSNLSQSAFLQPLPTYLPSYHPPTYLNNYFQTYLFINA